MLKKSHLLTISLAIILVLLLIGFGITGVFSRYLADDYCYDAQFMRQGFFNGQIDSYLNLMPYSSNRYSLTLFSSIFWILGGIKISPVIPLIAILFWGGSLFYTLTRINHVRKLHLTQSQLLFISLLLLFFTLLLAPNRYQILYWRSGILPYLFPLALNTFLIGRFLSITNKLPKLFHLIELGIWGWLAAGFSETIFAIQTLFWGLVFAFTIWKKNSSRQKAVLAILIGTFLGAGLLIFNPTNAIRQSYFSAPPSLIHVMTISLGFAYDFILDFISSYRLPIVMLLTCGVFTGWLLKKPDSLVLKKLLVFWIIITILFYGILVGLMAPTVWSMSAYPEPRGLLSGDYLTVIYVFFTGTLVGYYARYKFKFLTAPLPGILMAALISVYLIHFIPSIFQDIHNAHLRAENWDKRNAFILDQIQLGKTSLIVDGLDSVARIFELQPDPAHWVNRCAADYYQIESITTTE